MKKKIVAVMLASVMAMTALAGCSGGTSDSASEGSAQTESGSESGDSESGEKVKLTALFVAHPLTQDINNMKWLQEIADKAGVEIEWEQIYTDWDTTKSTRFASGDIPDLLFNATVDADYTTYSGLFMDMTEFDYSGSPAHPGRSSAQPDRASAHLIRSAVQLTPVADQHTY